MGAHLRSSVPSQPSRPSTIFFASARILANWPRGTPARVPVPAHALGHCGRHPSTFTRMGRTRTHACLVAWPLSRVPIEGRGNVTATRDGGPPCMSAKLRTPLPQCLPARPSSSPGRDIMSRGNEAPPRQKRRLVPPSWGAQAGEKIAFAQRWLARAAAASPVKIPGLRDWTDPRGTVAALNGLAHPYLRTRIPPRGVQGLPGAPAGARRRPSAAHPVGGGALTTGLSLLRQRTRCHHPAGGSPVRVCAPYSKAELPIHDSLIPALPSAAGPEPKKGPWPRSQHAPSLAISRILLVPAPRSCSPCPEANTSSSTGILLPLPPSATHSNNIHHHLNPSLSGPRVCLTGFGAVK
ncbi:hypothetical protein ACCO45_011274 [Purpureocillium lilacinum]|uniref:Uncharacterized protein n=1 Tax=Purpureocillium lilacinum TaxID=33203 RepID=A0ACC4DH44_PURLI